MSNATTGVPVASASTATMPNVSNRDGIATSRAAAISANRRRARRPSPTKRTRSASPACRHELAQPRLVRSAARDHEVAADPRGGQRPRLNQQVQALLGDLQPADEQHVRACDPGLQRRGRRDPVADHVDGRARVERLQPLAPRRARPATMRGVPAHPEPLDQVERQLVLAGLLAGVEPLDDADGRPAAPQRGGDARHRCEEVLDHQVRLPTAALADGGQRVPRGAGEPAAACADPMWT